MAEPSNSTLLVTGVAGFIGSNFARSAVQAGYQVVGVDSLTYAGHLENLAGLPAKKFQFVKEDIRSNNIGALLKKFHPNAVLNFAAESHVDRSIEEPLLFIDTNVRGTANLLHYSLDHWRKSGSSADFRFLQVSTDEVYGSLGPTGKFSENTQIAPSSPYSASKAAADHLALAWHHTYKLPTLVTRCSNNYGPYQYPEKLIPHMIRCALSGKALPVYGNGKNIRDWIHVEDHCEGILLALKKGTAGAVYCLGGNSEIENISLVSLICQRLDKIRPLKTGKSYVDQISFVTDRLGHDFRYAIDDSFAQTHLGFKRRHSFESGINATIDWYLENQEWMNAVLNKLSGEKK